MQKNGHLRAQLILTVDYRSPGQKMVYTDYDFAKRQKNFAFEGYM